MSPESVAEPITLMREAYRIKDEALGIQKELNEAHSKLLGHLLSGARERIGYRPLESVELPKLIDTRIESKTDIVSPEVLAHFLPVTQAAADTTYNARESLKDILASKDDRLIVIAGPCSIHDPDAAMEYAHYVKDWRDVYGKDLEIIMRSYPEKPRSEKDWKGLTYDPLLNDSNDINLGLILTRLLNCRIPDLGVPTGTERLNANTPQYTNALVAYDAVGARNVTDQKAREYGSGTSSPVGFKNPVDGKVGVAIQAVATAKEPHSFIGMDTNAMLMQVNTHGNSYAHIILRGSDQGPNYSHEDVQDAKKKLIKAGLPVAIIVDASHGNSRKQANRQIEVVVDIAEQIAIGEYAIKGVMIESNLKQGKQKFKVGETDPKLLEYGVSITDECSDISQTEAMLHMLALAVRRRRTTIQH